MHWRELHGGNCSEGSCSGECHSWIIAQGKVSWALIPADFNVEQLSGRYLSGEWLFRKKCPGVKNPWGTCHGGNFIGDIVRGICPVGSYSRRELSGRNFMRAVAQGGIVNGNCPGEISLEPFVHVGMFWYRFIREELVYVW